MFTLGYNSLLDPVGSEWELGVRVSTPVTLSHELNPFFITLLILHIEVVKGGGENVLYWSC